LAAYRLLGTVGALLVFAFTFINRAVDPAMHDPIWARLAVGVMLLLMVALSFVYAGRRFHYIAYFGYYVTTLWVVDLLGRNAFGFNFAFSLLVLVAGLSTLFRSRAALLCYGAVTLAAVVAAAVRVRSPVAVEVSFVSNLAMILALSFLALGSRLRTERELRRSREYHRAVLDNASDLISVLDSEGRILNESPSLTRLLGYSEEELVGGSAFDLLHPDDVHPVRQVFAEMLRTPDRTFTAEMRVRHRDGSWRVLEAKGRNLVGSPSVGAIVINSRDVTERRMVEERLLHEALHDPLTGLPNRFMFQERLEHAAVRAQRGDQPFALLFLDLNRFKAVNDSLGHAGGDELLRVVARRVRECVRGADTVARLGGDEFAVLLEGVAEPEGATEVAERIRDSIVAPVQIAGVEVFPAASIGIALSAQSGPDPAAALRGADIAMYQAKARGETAYELFSAEDARERTGELRLELGLRRALGAGELVLAYQPIVDLQSRAVVGFEALVRWPQPDGSLMAAGEFIPLAEETGLIVPLGEWVVRTACWQLRTWQLAHPRTPPLFMTVNLSAKQLLRTDLIVILREILRTTAIEPGSLRIELTESVLVAQGSHSERVLADLRGLGIPVYLDDFGTGYSSLTYLRHLPLSGLKIDRAFIARLGVDRRDDEIVQTILQIARNLGLEAVSEGIETEAQLVALQRLECSLGQGYHVAYPLPAEAAERLLATGEEEVIGGSRADGGTGAGGA
jgi:diguanylate cyclase (GGDEF)-like protein/PAS domain S-box-containing protein